MAFSRKRFPIIWKFGLQIFLAGALVLSIVTISIKGAFSLRGDSVAINRAGEQRMRLYKIAVLLREYIDYGSEDAKRELKKEMKIFEEVLEGLRYGNPGYGLKGAETRGIKEQMERNIGIWRKALKPLLEELTDMPRDELARKARFRRTYDETLFNFVKRMDKVTKLLEEDSSRKVRSYITYQYVLFFLLLFIALGSLYSIRRFVSGPVKRLTRASKIIASGDLSHRIDLRTRDEIGELGESFNYMARRLKESQRILLEREKLAALGTFCTCMAHDIRNPLSSVKMNLNILYKELPGVDTEKARKLKEHFNIALEEVAHMESILTDILDFARPSKLRLSRQDIDELIDDSLRMAEGEIRKKDIKVIKDTHEPGTVHVDGDKIKQALLNIYLNSVHAMSEGGLLRIRTFFRGASLFIVIEDNGTGMKPEVKEKVFEPFFTTRSDGTGLGMPVTKKIIEGHGGTIEVESAPERGTRVFLSLPVEGP